jgi:hypothetical protein
MIAVVRWGRKQPRSARLRAFDELVIEGLIHVEEMSPGMYSVSLGDGESCLFVSVSRRGVTLVEETGVRR